MKPLHIEFVPRQGWLAVWAVAVLICLGMACATAWSRHDANSASLHATARLTSLEQELAVMRTPPARAADARLPQAAKAAKLLQQDMNTPFAVIENLKEPQTRLRHLYLDVESGAIRLEYELDSMMRASTVTAVLNAGYDEPPWQLESLTSGRSGSGSVSSSPGVLGLWSSQLDKLK